MIGGQDILIPCAEPSVALDLATRTVTRYWSEAHLEDGESGDVLSPYRDAHFAGIREILITKTQQASDLWDKLGACEATNGTLIHLLASGKTLTVVIDDEPSEEMINIVREIRGSLIQELFTSTAETKVAA
ncbi:MAG TPA: hypothetical protein VH370_03625 [Humisphaera sp.]|jgi:hypothetical protein|nr:hypothetical protein [Humisphaera sp.]